jgi:hypothetical protein
MKIQIEVDVDNSTGYNFEHLTPETKTRIMDSITNMLKETVGSERKAQLQQLLEELQKESDYSTLDPEVLYELFRDGED